MWALISLGPRVEIRVQIAEAAHSDVVEPSIVYTHCFADPRDSIFVHIAEALIHVGAKVVYSLVKIADSIVHIAEALIYVGAKIVYSLA